MDLRIKPDIDFSITEREKVVLKAIVDHPGSTAPEIQQIVPQWTRNNGHVVARATSALEARRLIESRRIRRIGADGRGHSFVTWHPTVKGIKEASK